MMIIYGIFMFLVGIILAGAPGLKWEVLVYFGIIMVFAGVVIDGWRRWKPPGPGEEDRFCYRPPRDY